MRTSVIRYRVADFLKRYPPFNEMSELDLLDLASSGRVVFHESDEYIFRKDEDRGPYIWVVQQGRVHLLSESDGEEHLKDMLGEGDILGLGRILGKTQYRYSAKTESDVILYSIDGGTFEELARRNPKISKYLSAHFSLSERYEDAVRKESSKSDAGARSTGDVSWLEIPGPDALTISESLVILNENDTARTAAQLMKQEERAAIAVVDSHGFLIGLVQDLSLRDQLAEGADLSQATAGAIAQRTVAISSSRAAASDYFLEMMRSRTEVLAITEDGTPGTNLLGVLEPARLALSTGWNPVLLSREIHSKRSTNARRRHLAQATTMVAAGLTDTACVDQSARLASELLDVVVERLILSAEEDLLGEGQTRPNGEICWLVFGMTARRENFPFRLPQMGAILDDSLDIDQNARAYVVAVLEKVVESAASIGLATHDDARGSATCLTLSEWDQYFATRISDPIGNQVYLSRESFDFRALFGEQTLEGELHRRVELALEASSSFIAVLANDTMSNLPPLTFFRGVVVDLDGVMSETLDIEKTLLAPISDAARVLGLASRDLSAASTLERLERGQRVLPGSVAALLEAAEAFRIASYQSTRARLQAGGSESTIRPSSLSRYDQRQLKNAFTAVQGLLELTATAFY